MPQVVVSFHDGEVLHAATPELTFDRPILQADVESMDSNSDRALLPLGAIRQLIVGEAEPAPPPEVLETWDRAAFHFLDGQVLRAFIAPDVVLGRHGGIWRIVERGSTELHVLAVPYSSLKGVFRLRGWDSRPRAEREARDAGAPVHLEHTVRALAERDQRARRHPPVTRSPLLDRVQRHSPPEDPQTSE